MMKIDRFFSLSSLARAAALLLVCGSVSSSALLADVHNEMFIPNYKVGGVSGYNLGAIFENSGSLAINSNDPNLIAHNYYILDLGVSFLESINHLDESNSFGLAGLPYIKVQLSQSEFDMIKEKSKKGYCFVVGWEDNYDGTHMDIKGYVSMGGSIWYGEKTKLNYTEDWPTIAQALKDNGVTLPDWALGACPWANQEELTAALKPGSSYYEEIQKLQQTLSTDSKALDILFRFGAWKRFLTAIDPYSDACDHYIFAGTTPGDTQLLADRLNAIAAVKDAAGHPLGLYALIDYDNFKGEGTSPTEIHNTQHWGLQAVLRNMDSAEMEVAGPLQAFIDSALKTLDARIANTEMEADRNNTPITNDHYDPTSDPKKFWPFFENHVNGYLNWE